MDFWGVNLTMLANNKLGAPKKGEPIYYSRGIYAKIAAEHPYKIFISVTVAN